MNKKKIFIGVKYNLVKQRLFFEKYRKEIYLKDLFPIFLTIELPGIYTYYYGGGI